MRGRVSEAVSSATWRRNVLDLAVDQLIALDDAALTAGHDDAGVQRVGMDVAEFVSARRGYPFHESDLSEGAAAGSGGGTRILLRAVNPIGEPGVGRDMVELAVGKVVPVQIPGMAAVHADGGALVHPEIGRAPCWERASGS